MSVIRLRSIVDISKKDDEIADMYFIINFKNDDISSDCNQIKIRTQCERITYKKAFQLNQKIDKFGILIKILRNYGLKLEVREEEKVRN